jgi:NitT/TauT family transport system substrate-binding protein
MPELHLSWRRFACALVLIIALPGSTFAQTSSPLIRVGAGPDDTSMPVIYAASAGLFAKAGLNVELEKLAGAAVVAAALAGGSLEIGKASALSVVTAHAKGLPFTAIGAIATYDSTSSDFGMLVLNSYSIKTPQDLVGKTLAAVSLQDMSTIATYAWLAQNGVDSSSLKFAEMPASATFAAMEQGRVAGSTIYEPMLSAAMATGRARVIGHPYDAIGKHFSGGLLIANTSWVAEHRDLVDRFLRVMQTAGAYVHAHEDEMAPILAAYTGVDPATITKFNHEGRGVALTPADIQPVIDAAAKYKVIPQAFPASDLICGCAIRR